MFSRLVPNRVSVALLRRCFVGLGAASIAATAIELALSRHWTSAVQLIPWYALGALAVALALVLVRPRPATVRVAGVLIVAVMLTAVLGIYEHVLANYRAAPLDFRYTARWSTMAARSRWWAAMSQAVGPSPTLAPAALAETAICLLFATLGLPSGTAESVPRRRGRSRGRLPARGTPPRRRPEVAVHLLGALQPGEHLLVSLRRARAVVARRRAARAGRRTSIVTALAPTLEAYFTERLVRQRQASPNTVAAYRDAWRLLLGFAKQRTKKQPCQLDGQPRPPALDRPA